MKFKHTDRNGFWLGYLDFFLLGLFFVYYMPKDGLQDELDYILSRRTLRYWIVYLLGIPTAFLFTLVWFACIAQELRNRAMAMGIEGPHTSWWHLFCWNTFGMLTGGPGIATKRFFDTLNKIERKMNGEAPDAGCS